MKFSFGPWAALGFLAALTGSGLAQEQDSFAHGQRRDIAGSANVSTAPLPGGLHPIPAMEGDEEFGEQIIIERTSNWYPTAFQATISGYRTDNRSCPRKGARPTTISEASPPLSFTPAIKGNLFADLGVFEETYRYDRLGELDFDYTEATADFSTIWRPARSRSMPSSETDSSSRTTAFTACLTAYSGPVFSQIIRPSWVFRRPSRSSGDTRFTTAWRPT